MGEVDDGLRIGHAAALLDVSVDTVRRWEREGEIELTRSEGGQRLVPLAEVRRLLDERGHTRHRLADTSTRNQLDAIVTEVVADRAAATVEMLAGPYRLVALTTAESVRELDLRPGSRVVATVKATNVSVAVPAT